MRERTEKLSLDKEIQLGATTPLIEEIKAQREGAEVPKTSEGSPKEEPKAAEGNTTATEETFAERTANVEPSNADWSDAELERAKADGYKEGKLNKDGIKVSPGEFNRRGPLFDAIEDRNRKLDQALAEMKRIQADMDRKQKEAEMRGYQAALADLNQKRDNAIEYGDKAAVYAIEAQTRDLANRMEQAHPPVPAASQVDPIAAEYFENNKDFLSDPDLFAVAQSYEARIQTNRTNQGLPPLDLQTVGVEIRKYIMDKFPSKFENKAKEAPPAVMGSSSASRHSDNSDVGGRYTVDDLSDNQRVIFERIRKTADPTMTVDKYFALMSGGQVKLK